MDPTTLAAALLAALLALAPHSPAQACLRARAPQITAALVAGQATRGVPAGVLLAVGFLETWDGCHRNEGGGWGAPASFHNRRIAGTADDAAAVLQHGMRLCGSWTRAIAFFRSGVTADRCRPVVPRYVDYVRRAVHLTERLYAAAGAPPPDALR